MQQNLPNTGIILTGGGARAAYQVGVLKAVYQTMPKGTLHPFPIICGSSAGAINAAAIACYAGQYRTGLRRLEKIWTTLHVEDVFKSDFSGMLKQASGFLWHIITGRSSAKLNALLDNQPLRKLLEKTIPFRRIDKLIDEGLLKALCITCNDYYSGDSYSFFQGHSDIDEWQRHRRLGIRDTLKLDHLMASSAIPLLFPSVKIDAQYFGDGSVGCMSPISPAIRLGAERVMIIGLDQMQEEPGYICYDKPAPSFADVAGRVLDTVFIDSLESDLERLERINRTLKSIPKDLMTQVDLPLKTIDTLLISPSEDLSELANQYAKSLPRATRFFMSRLGVDYQQGSHVLSYVLFEGDYCQRLIDLGYQDAMARKDEIYTFFNPDH